MYDSCLRDIARQGLHVVTGTGYRMPSPAATTAIKLASQLLQLEQSLGLTPRSRARMKLAVSSESTDDQLMKKMCSGQHLSKLEWEQLGRD
jgi:P27 family predicted phage terminase small subunit